MIQYTQLKNTNRRNLMEVMPLAKPFTLLIEPSSLCNFRCVQCFQSLKEASYFTRTRMHMPLERFRRIMEQLQAWPGERLKVLKLSLYGEPLLSPDFAEMLRLAREADIADRIETTSNVSLLTPEVARAMVANQLDYLRVSIYAADAARHREVTGSTVSPAQIHENLRMLQEEKRRMNSARPFVSPKMLDSGEEANREFMEMYRDVGDELYLDQPHGWIKVNADANFMERYYGDNESIVQEPKTARVACPMAFTTMAVRANGDVSPCCVDFIGGTNLGNVDECDLQTLWGSKEWYRFQKMQLEGRKQDNFSCARCDIYLSDHYTRDNIDGFPVEKLLAHKQGTV